MSIDHFSLVRQDSPPYTWIALTLHLRIGSYTALIWEKWAMRSNVTNTLLTKLKPDTKPYEVRDLRLKGLLLRVQPSGVMTWYVEYGRGKRARLGRADAITASEARARAKRILGEAYQGRDPMAATRLAKARSYREFVDEVYGPWALEHLRSGNDAANRLLRSFPDLHWKKLGEIKSGVQCPLKRGTWSFL